MSDLANIAPTAISSSDSTVIEGKPAVLEAEEQAVKVKSSGEVVSPSQGVETQLVSSLDVIESQYEDVTDEAEAIKVEEDASSLIGTVWSYTSPWLKKGYESFLRPAMQYYKPTYVPFFDTGVTTFTAGMDAYTEGNWDEFDVVDTMTGSFATSVSGSFFSLDQESYSLGDMYNDMGMSKMAQTFFGENYSFDYNSDLMTTDFDSTDEVYLEEPQPGVSHQRTSSQNSIPLALLGEAGDQEFAVNQEPEPQWTTHSYSGYRNSSSRKSRSGCKSNTEKSVDCENLSETAILTINPADLETALPTTRQEVVEYDTQDTSGQTSTNTAMADADATEEVVVAESTSVPTAVAVITEIDTGEVEELKAVADDTVFMQPVMWGGAHFVLAATPAIHLVFADELSDWSMDDAVTLNIQDSESGLNIVTAQPSQTAIGTVAENHALYTGQQFTVNLKDGEPVIRSGSRAEGIHSILVNQEVFMDQTPAAYYGTLSFQPEGKVVLHGGMVMGLLAKESTLNENKDEAILIAGFDQQLNGIGSKQSKGFGDGNPDEHAGEAARMAQMMYEGPEVIVEEDSSMPEPLFVPTPVDVMV
jgi:hypothetical protein